MVGLAACGAPNDPGSAASTPSSGDLTISDLPLPAAARSAGGTATEGSTTSASYLVDGSSPAQILTFYDDRLPSLGWELEKPDAATGDGDADATWLQANSKLLISVEAHAGTGGDAGVITQLDLEITDQ